MKRTLAAAGCLILLASVCHAQKVKQDVITATIGTNAATAVTQTLDTVSGWIHEIKIDMTGTDTGNCAVVAIPTGEATTTFGNVTLAAKTNVTAETIFRPLFDYTDNAGSALTGDPPGPYMCSGATLQFTVTGGVTGNVYKALIKWISTVGR